MAVEAPAYIETSTIRHNCGIVGIYAPGRDVVGLGNMALQHLNHRGQEGSGMVAVTGDGTFNIHKGVGYARNVFGEEAVRGLRENDPFIVVGHDRYSTSGKMDAWQPFVSRDNSFGLVHNGNITNAEKLRARLPIEEQISVVSDSDVVVKTIEHAQGNTMSEKIANACSDCEGAYNLIITTPDSLYAVKDPKDMRPLTIGVLPLNGGEKQGYVIASESSAFAHMGAHQIRDVKPGEGVVINENGIQTFFVDKRMDPKQLARCIFEFVYLAAPDSIIWGKSVSEIRRAIGSKLAEKDINEWFLPDIIIPVQKSGIPYAEGYAQKFIEEVSKEPQRFGLNWEDLHKVLPRFQTVTGLVANDYSGRTFILPNDRLAGVNGKHRPDQAVLKGRKVVWVDDSIVRGNTSPRMNNLITGYGQADEVHGRIGSPAIRNPCFMGVDFAEREKLIANKVTGPVEEGVRNLISADSLRYIQPLDLLKIVIGEEKFGEIVEELIGDNQWDPNSVEIEDLFYQKAGYCGSCFLRSGRYPMDVSGVFRKEDAVYERK